MAFEARAIENIATAPAEPAERGAALWVAGALLAAFAMTVPFGAVQLGPVLGFVPTVVGAAALAQALTAILLYVQYRIARTWQLGLLALAYASSALLTGLYICTFPGVFSATGLFGATSQTAAWSRIIAQLLFGALLSAFALSDRFAWRFSRPAFRWVAALVAGLTALAVFVALRVSLPTVIDGTRGTPFFRDIIGPLELGEMIVALMLLITSGMRTVSQVWLVVVALMSFVGVVEYTVLSSGRYTVGFYAAGVDSIVGSFVILAIFLVKINDLLVRLATRNRALTERTFTAELEVVEGELRYQSLANVVPQLIWSCDAAGTIDYVNERWIAFTGLDANETRTVGWRAALDANVPTTLEDGWHRSLQTGVPYSAEHEFREAETGRLRWFLIDAVPVHDAAGDVVRWIGSCTDIDRNKRIEEREAFLARAGARLSASLDVGATLGTISALAIERMASWARVDLLDEDGRFVTRRIASPDPVEEAALRALIGASVDGAVEALFLHALDGREPVVHADLLALAGGARGVRRRGSALVVPLVSGATRVGILTLAAAAPATLDADDVALARDFARRAAQALDHARLYERERTTADALQRAMLPQLLPQLDGLSFSASYSAASETQRVGGDFYDAFVLPDESIALTIGDVTGHGLEAAVIMGEIRQALRAASFELAEPSSILDRASQLLIASGRSVFVTAVFGVLDRRTGTFRYATAGHPSPLVYGRSRLRRLSSSGLPIGLRDDEGVDFSVVLEPGSTIVLYTDGLMEFSRNLDDGERRIEAAIRELADGDVTYLANAIMKRVLGDDQPTDDIAILTATLQAVPLPATDDAHAWRFHSNDARTAVLVRHELGALIAGWTGRPETVSEIELVFGELFSNVVRHAPGPLDVRAMRSAGGARLTVTDTGRGFVNAGTTNDALAESGRGLMLVRTIASGVTIAAAPGVGSTVTVTFAAEPAAVG